MRLVSRALRVAVLAAALAWPAGAATGSVLPGGYADTVLDTGPVAYWGLGETTGPTLDHVGGHNGGYVAPQGENVLLRDAPGAPVRGPLDPGGIFVRDSAKLSRGGGYNGGYATLAGDTRRGFYTTWQGPFTVNLWIRWDDYLEAFSSRIVQNADERQGIIGNGNGTSFPGGWLLEIPGAPAGQTRGPRTLRFIHSYVGAAVSSGELPVGEWVMVTASWDGATARIYRNGALAGATPAPNASTGGYPWIMVGRGDFNSFLGGYWGYFHGAIDEVTMWNRALSAEEVARIYGAAGPTRQTLVFVPGLGGSALDYTPSLLPDVQVFPAGLFVPPLTQLLAVRAEDGVTSVHPIAATGVIDSFLTAEVYGPALRAFSRWEEEGIIDEFVPFPYDFRLGTGQAAASLAAALEERCGSEAVWLVAHSTGGLVVKRALRLLRESGDPDLAPERCLGDGGVVFVAVPHVGAPKAIGSAISPDNFFGSLLEKLVADERSLARVLNNWLTVWELMPQRGRVPAAHPEAREPWFDDPNDGLGDRNVDGGQLNWALDARSLHEQPLHADLAATIGAVPAYNVVGYGLPTPGSYDAGVCWKDPASGLRSRLRVDEWGNHASLDFETSGDGTVPGWSAVWPSSGLGLASQYALPRVKHTEMAGAPETLALLLLLIGGAEYPDVVGMTHGDNAVDIAEAPPPPGWRTSFCSPVAAVATQAGARSGLLPDGTVLEGIDGALVEASGPANAPTTTIVVPQIGPAVPPSYELVAVSSGPVTIWHDEPDGSHHDFVLVVEEGDRATMRLVGGEWVLEIDRGGDGTVDETLAANHPLVSVGPVAAPVEEGSAAEVSARAVSQAGEDVTHAWELVAGNGSIEGAGPTVVYRPDDGPSTARLRVTVADESGRAASAEVELDVLNVPPAVSAGDDRTAAWGVPVTFEGRAVDPSAADAAAGLVASWSFGAGTLAASHAFPEPGATTVTLTARDKDGGEGTDTVAVEVTKRAATVALELAAKIPYGTRQLAASIADAVDGASARLTGRTLVFEVDGVEHRAETDAAGRAGAELALPLLPGRHVVTVRLDDALYEGATSEEVVVSSTAGTAAGEAALESGARLTLGVRSDGSAVHGTVLWKAADGRRVHVSDLSALGISDAGLWVAGVADGVPVVVHAAAEIVDVWIGGERSGGRVARGRINARPAPSG